MSIYTLHTHLEKNEYNDFKIDSTVIKYGTEMVACDTARASLCAMQ